MLYQAHRRTRYHSSHSESPSRQKTGFFVFDSLLGAKKTAEWELAIVRAVLWEYLEVFNSQIASTSLSDIVSVKKQCFAINIKKLS